LIVDHIFIYNQEIYYTKTKLQMREIVLDTETTGINPFDGHKIIEIGCVELSSYYPTGNNFHTYLNPQRDVPEEAFKIHGISSKMLQDKPTFEKIADEFLAFIADSKLVIHNAKFDLGFLNHELKKVGKKPIEEKQSFCTFRYAKQKFPGEKASLNELCKRFKIDISERTLHGALLDATLLAKLYAKLFGVEQGNLVLSKVLENQVVKQGVALNRTIAQNQLTEEELENHKNFVLKNLKNNMWGY
jgi:DNA polymerase-3 subunit epsilon